LKIFKVHFFTAWSLFLEGLDYRAFLKNKVRFTEIPKGTYNDLVKQMCNDNKRKDYDNEQKFSSYK
jgi:hypothetical protein